ncbi:MAG: hypothetical protein HY877_03825 [Deltaproteobacteria bacterium]|nr:hypothetical protein [Deltaproteobacteria bacterium]
MLAQIRSLLQEIGVSVIPGANDVVDFYEFLFGKDYLSGRELTPFERSFSAVGLVIGSGHGFRKGGEKVKKLIQEGIKRGTLKEGAGRGATQALERGLEGLKPKYTVRSAAHVEPNHVNLNREKRRSKFLPEEGGQAFVDEVAEKAWKQGNVTIQPQDGRIRFDANLGRTVGTRGETRGRVILDPSSGEVITQFPQK